MSVRLLAGDCLDQMAKLDSASVDAVMTDPPYCSGGYTEAGRGRATHQGLRSEGIRAGRFAWFDGDNMTTPGFVWLLRAMAVEAARILKPSGHLLVFCDWRMAFSLAPALESSGLRLRGLIVWNKGSMGLGTGFRPQHELIVHLTHRAPEFHAADVPNVLTCKRVAPGQRIHATEKPVDLMRSLIRVATPPQGLIVDPFAGSGSTGVAAQIERRGAILIERDPDMLAKARRRLEADAGMFAEIDGDGAGRAAG